MKYCVCRLYLSARVYTGSNGSNNASRSCRNEKWSQRLPQPQLCMQLRRARGHVDKKCIDFIGSFCLTGTSVELVRVVQESWMKLHSTPLVFRRSSHPAALVPVLRTTWYSPFVARPKGFNFPFLPQRRSQPTWTRRRQHVWHFKYRNCYRIAYCSCHITGDRMTCTTMFASLWNSVFNIQWWWRLTFIGNTAEYTDICTGLDSVSLTWYKILNS